MPADRRSDHSSGNEIGQSIGRGVDSSDAGDRSPSIGHDDGRSLLDVAEVLAEVVLQLAHPDLNAATRCSDIHGLIVAPSARTCNPGIGTVIHASHLAPGHATPVPEVAPSGGS